MSNIDRISKRVEADRAELAHALDALTETVKPQTVVDELTAAATEIGGAMTNKAWGSLRDNPAGGLLVTLGLGLLASGPPKRPRAETQPVATDPDTALAGFDARVAKADAEMRAEMTGEMPDQPDASRMKAALNAGLDHLPPAARKRIIRARKAVMETQESIERKSKRAARKTKGFIHTQPITAGALAFGFGVLAAAVLPGTRREDALLGKRRDALMAEAHDMLEDELRKAKAQAENALAQ
ncbi:DUF3618 domain-containing protein [Yoonia sp.]|uniref:DUF3618 domain-containing protein n=1 Tax=Yoonia sp. TaxID=2212373 RepID=UPI00358EF1E5